MWFLLFGYFLDDWFLVFFVWLLEVDVLILWMLCVDFFYGEWLWWVCVVLYCYCFVICVEYCVDGVVWVWMGCCVVFGLVVLC